MRRLFVLALACATGCVGVDKATRTERGPLLRTFHRQEVLEGPLRAHVTAQWPRLTVEVIATDVCRDLTVEEYAEERITETSSPAAGPALSTGISMLAASAILLGVSAAVSGQPDTSLIDAKGNYGPSTRQYVQAWSLGTLIVGAPALAVGIISMLRAGEDVVPLRAEQVVSQKDEKCHERPFLGPLHLEGPHGPATADKALVEGRASFEATELKALVEGFKVAAREVEVDDAAETVLDAFNACVEFEATAGRGTDTLTDEGLAARSDALIRCRVVRGEAVNEPLKAVDAELARRRGAAQAPAAAMSFEQALAVQAPRLTLAVGSRDLALLAAPEALAGQSVLLEGVAGAPVSDELMVVTVGEQQLFAQFSSKAFKAELPPGTRLELVGVLDGLKTVEAKKLPLVRVLAARRRF
jgi:hypothetical protein